MFTTVLLVDDDEAVSVLLEHAIKRGGHDISLKWVSDGEAAIQYLSRQGEYADPHRFPFPSLILLDLKMPKVTGFEVLEWKQMQAELEGLPVVIWSSSDLTEDRERANKLGATSYFLKPMDADGFRELVEHLERYHVLNFSN